ncbi:hypothetical protein LRS74_29140 [Streptomyces sp. LX-29]|uniref:hypothetical protein n=1 Tax=Streptomyces sp. LX-29 TaxID=2900152 RepID=UPI00240D8B63|nr:hypothetical protein [Streptomyces sp. LX-29]WFB10647.1 hypothetical protein LRS74_29140 [Streptomyces sp. LX-29]
MRVLPVERAEASQTALRLVDAGSGHPVAIDPGYREPLRVAVEPRCDEAYEPAYETAAGAAPGTAGAADSAVDAAAASGLVDAELTGLRVRLVGDVLARTAELFGGQALVGVVRSGGRGDALEARAAALGVRPAAVVGDGAEVTEALGGKPEVHVTGARGGDAEAEYGIVLRVGVVHAPGGARSTGAGATGRGPSSDVAAVVAGDEPGADDPLALRLALLSRPYYQLIELTPDVLAEARHTLERWRREVAGWARAPSKPMCAEVLAEALGGLEADLFVPAVLDGLRRLAEDPGLPDGSRFETAAHLDRVLALDLVREVGRDASAAPREPAP